MPQLTDQSRKARLARARAGGATVADRVQDYPVPERAGGGVGPRKLAVRRREAPMGGRRSGRLTTASPPARDVGARVAVRRPPAARAIALGPGAHLLRTACAIPPVGAPHNASKSGRRNLTRRCVVDTT
jgi:hypothetical protein